MKHGFQAMDSDLHVFEPPDLWQRYIDRKFRADAPVGRNRHPRDALITWRGLDLGQGTMDSPIPKPRANRHAADDLKAIYEDGDRNGYDPGSQLRAMDREGLDTAVLFPSRSLFTLAVDGMPGDLSAAIARAYNTWLAEFVAADRARMFGAAQVTPHDIDAAVAELHRCVKDHGFRGVFVRPEPINGRPWHDRHYDPLWAACQEHDVAVAFHMGASAPQINGNRNQGGWFFRGNTMLHHTLSHPLTAMSAVVSMCGGGVLERFPNLRVAFLEANCSWVPWLLWRLDEHHEWLPADAPELKHRPSDYFKRQCFASVEADEHLAAGLLAEGYGQCMVFSTDYPHEDGKYPHAVDNFLKIGLPVEARRAILWDNCRRLYGL